MDSAHWTRDGKSNAERTNLCVRLAQACDVPVKGCAGTESAHTVAAFDSGVSRGSVLRCACGVLRGHRQDAAGGGRARVGHSPPGGVAQ
jgi:hypothetical protein